MSMSSSSSDYSEDYEEEYDYSEASSDDSSSTAAPPTTTQKPAPLNSCTDTHAGVSHVYGSSKATLCLSDSQRTAIKDRRPVWCAVLKDRRIVLSTMQCTLLQKQPHADHDLLLSAMGPYATVLSASCQTDTQGSQAPQDLMETLQLSCVASKPLYHDSSQAGLEAAAHIFNHAGLPVVKGFSESAGAFPAPPTAFPQRQIVSHVAISTNCQQPVVAVVYAPVVPAETDDGSIIRVAWDKTTSTARLLGLHCESIVALWNLRDASSSISPAAVLMSHSPLVCCDLKPADGSFCEQSHLAAPGASIGGFIVVGGCVDGTLCVWDTRSHPHMHCSWQGSAEAPAEGPKGLKADGECIGGFRRQQAAVYAPVFSTICTEHYGSEAVQDMKRASCGSSLQDLQSVEEVTQVAIVSDAESLDAKRESERRESASSNFSVLILTATGVVSLWAVVVARAVARTSPGSFLLDTHGASVRLVNLHRVVKHGAPRATAAHTAGAFAPATCLAVCASSPTTFLVGSGAGTVTRGALHAPQPSPQAYHIQDVHASFSESVSSIHACCAQPVGSRVIGVAVHPSTPSVFLVAYDMGCLAVYVAQKHSAVLVRSCACTLLAAVWLPGRTDCFAAVTTSGSIAVFNVTSDDLKPAQEYKLKLSEGEECTSACISPWRHSDNTAKQNTGGAADVLIIGLSSGRCVYHVLAEPHETSSLLWTAETFVAKLLGST